MSVALSLLAARVCDDILTVDLESRRIIIPDTVENLGVESDDNVRILHFQVPRHYCEVDLAGFSIRINYKNAAGLSDDYDVEDPIIEDHLITFDWVVSRAVVAKKGDVTFNVCLREVVNGNTDREFNTSVATLPVLEGLQTGDEYPVEDSGSGDSSGTSNAVQYVEQILNDAQKAQARTNIGAIGSDDIRTEYDNQLYEHAKAHGYTGEKEEFYESLAKNVQTLKGDSIELDPEDNTLYITSGDKRIGNGIELPKAVEYESQSLTEEQKRQARMNINVLSRDHVELNPYVIYSVSTLTGERIMTASGFGVTLYDEDGNKMSSSAIAIDPYQKARSYGFAGPEAAFYNQLAYLVDGMDLDTTDNKLYLTSNGSRLPMMGIALPTTSGETGGGGSYSTARIGWVELPASAWESNEAGNLHSQVVEIAGVTKHSQVDLTPSVEQLVVFYEKDLTLVTENDDGVVTVYAIGQKPAYDYVIQVTITEVNV